MAESVHHVPDAGHERPRVLVLCDQPLTGEALRVALRARGFPAVGLGAPRPRLAAHHVSGAIDRFEVGVGLMVQERPDELHLRESLRILREVDEVPWLVLSHSPPGPLWGAALEAGARAVQQMDIGLDRLEEALGAVTHGVPLMSVSRRQGLIEVWHRASAGQREMLRRLARLSPRETTILMGLAGGLPVCEIAERDGVHVTTVRSQVKAVLQKLEVRSQLSAVAALQQARELMHPQPDLETLNAPYRPPAE